ncbi:MAG TPA: hypothetical protein VED24_01350 [Candidatus Acidoferrum sp.]|nr:hypothetical protein [Candidatus Acidoferrum sp.]
MAKDKETAEIRAMEEDFKALKKDIDTQYVEIRNQIKDLQQKATKTLTERPLLALGVAFVVGMAFGVAMSRSKD